MPVPAPVDSRRADISLAHAGAVWAIAWIAGYVIAGSVLSAAGYDSTTNAPIWVTMAAAFAIWAPMIAALWAVTDRYGQRSFAVDFGLRFEVVDLAGIAIGAVSQLVLLRLIYWPLGHAWPNTFDKSHVERNARDMYHQAHGGWLLGLILIVVVGAPFVEELVYRGLLQRAALRRLKDAVAVVGVAALFTLIHFRPVEYPGLFAFGLVLGVCAWRTRRLGMGILAHMAFNATGLMLVARL